MEFKALCQLALFCLFSLKPYSFPPEIFCFSQDSDLPRNSHMCFICLSTVFLFSIPSPPSERLRLASSISVALPPSFLSKHPHQRYKSCADYQRCRGIPSPPKPFQRLIKPLSKSKTSPGCLISKLDPEPIKAN